MKKLLLIIAMVGVVCAGCFASWLIATNRQKAEDFRLLALQQAGWAKEKSELQDALAKARTAQAPTPATPRPAPVATLQTPSPKEIIEALSKSRGSDSRRLRFAIQQFEVLIGLGKNALPAIREFLAQSYDVDYNSPGSRFGRNGSVPTEFVLPPSLRFGLFDVVKQIGGPEAERILADVLRTTGRGLEVAYLARALEEMVPGKYRALAVSVAGELLTSVTTPALDKNERDYLYGVLAMYNDPSLVTQAQSQLIQADGKVDRPALGYLQKALGDRAIATATQAYGDSRVVDPNSRESLARVGLFFAGENEQANQLFDLGVRDDRLSVDARRNLIEDLNQDGIINEKHPTREDQRVIDARLQLIVRYADQITDPLLRDAFAEAQKDLQNMQATYAPPRTTR